MRKVSHQFGYCRFSAVFSQASGHFSSDQPYPICFYNFTVGEYSHPTPSELPYLHVQKVCAGPGLYLVTLYSDAMNPNRAAVKSRKLEREARSAQLSTLRRENKKGIPLVINAAVLLRPKLQVRAPRCSRLRPIP